MIYKLGSELFDDSWNHGLLPLGEVSSFYPLIAVLNIYSFHPDPLKHIVLQVLWLWLQSPKPTALAFHF